jgi:hypothetical protein
MFAIIIAIVAIALTILASIVTIMYLSDDGKSSAKAEAGRIIQEASQIRGAILIARNDGVQMSTQDTLGILKPKYLADIPQGASAWGLGENQVFKTDVRDTVCVAANLSMGIVYVSNDSRVRLADDGQSVIPFCDKTDLAANTPCCDNTPAAVVAP